MNTKVASVSATVCIGGISGCSSLMHVFHFFRAGRVCTTTTTSKNKPDNYKNYFSTAAAPPKPKSTLRPCHTLGFNWLSTHCRSILDCHRFSLLQCCAEGGLPTKNSDLVQSYEGPRKILFLPPTTGHTKTTKYPLHRLTPYH